ncbi:MAG: hypothetical protein WBD95_13310 [Xanthobacteraceae bacterium]
MTAMTVERPAKLPVFRTVGQAYALWMQNFSDLIRICGFWMVLMAPVLLIWNRMQSAHLAELVDIFNSGQPFVDPNPVLTALQVLAGRLIMLPPLASAAVAWHRLLLRDEHPVGTYLRLDGTVGSYAILAFLIGMIITAPSSMTFLLPNAGPASGTSTVIIVQALANIVTIVGIFIVPRLSLALPGIALGRTDVTIAAAWRVSKRNTWRMVWACLFCILPWGAVGGAMSYWLVQPGNNRVAVMLVSVVIGLLWIPAGMISVGMLSLAYRHFFERQM